MFDRVLKAARRLRDDKSAVTALEYALLGTFLFLAIIAGVKTIAPPITAILLSAAASV